MRIAARSLPTPIAIPRSEAACARLSLIFAASGKPPVIPVMTSGAFSSLPNIVTRVSMSAKSISGSALWTS
ncbi:MAG: hypothetical protein LVQ64_05390 [Thermoplasmatales archaeon]|nr:hypothetical protein [Thermoplasmatales archaeon]